MNYRVLGRTGLRISEIGMGSEGLEGASHDAVKDMVDAAIAGGINYFDCYNSNPVMRDNLGKALLGRRDQVIIQGHICSAFKDGQYYRTREMDVVRAAFMDLLTRLQTDYIDVGMIHYVDTDEDYNAVMSGPIIAYAQELKAKGAVRHIGMSSHNPTVALRAAESGLIDVLMFSLNPAYDLLPANDDVYALFEEKTYESDNLNGIDPERSHLYRTCETLGVAITVMKGFAAGALLDAAKSPFAAALTTTQCLHYALNRPGVATVLVGARNCAEIESAVAYATANDAEKDYSLALSKAPKHSFTGMCMYCGHCAPCSAGIDIALVNKYLDLAQAQPELPETVREHYRVLQANAADCVACGICETNCPFGVRIVERMQEAKRVFGE